MKKLEFRGEGRGNKVKREMKGFEMVEIGDGCWDVA